MNEALFISRTDGEDNAVLFEISKIRCAQEAISQAINILEIKIGNIEFLKDEEIYKSVVMVDEELLNECCETISKDAYLIKEAYEQLLKMGIFKKKNRELSPGPNFIRPECQQLS